jgi:hypothetical protein
MDFSKLKEKVLSNKTSRSVSIPHMEEAMVPWNGSHSVAKKRVYKENLLGTKISQQRYKS